MRLTILTLQFLIVFCAYGAGRCGAYSCLNVNQNAMGTQVSLTMRQAGNFACYMRYENTVKVDKSVTTTFGPLKLRPGYSPALVQFRCDPKDHCPAWMKNYRICEKYTRNTL